MRIVHVAKTPVAGAMEALSSAIRDYTEHDSRAINSGGKVNNLEFPHDLVFSDSGIFPALARADAIVFHQNVNHQSQPFRDFLDGDPSKKCLGFYHSHPDACDPGVAQAGFPHFCIAQYQSLLWRNAIPIRNVIRFDRDDWPKRDAERARERKGDGKLWIGYAPTFRQSQKDQTPGSSQWHHSKGYDVTMPILEKIDKDFPGLVEVMVFEGIRYDSCIKGKALCDILVDEVVTGSYHRNTLEGLALGIPTACNVSPEVHGVLVKAAGANDFPVVHATAETLDEKLRWLVGLDEKTRRRMGNGSHDWMCRHWHPRDIAREFCAHVAAAPSYGEVAAKAGA